MKLDFFRHASIRERDLRCKLAIIEYLIFVLPFLVLTYMIYRNGYLLKVSQLLLFALTLFLILFGLILLRQLFDRFLKIAASIKRAESGERSLVEIQKESAELREITTSFNNLMIQFRDTTDELGKRTFELLTIKELTELAARSLDIDDLLRILLERGMAVSGARIGSVFLVEHETHRFRVVATEGLESGPKVGTYLDINESLASWVVLEKSSLCVQDIETDTRTRKPNDPKYGAPSFLSLPVFAREELMAVLNLSCKENQQVFNSHDEHILSIMIGEIGFALENARLHSQVVDHARDLQEHTNALTRANSRLQREISDRKQAEETLRESEQKYRLVVDNTNEGIFVVQDGMIKFPNPATLALSGYTEQELLKIPFVSLIHQEDRDTVLERHRRIQEGEESTTASNIRLMNKSGEEAWIELRAVTTTWEGRLSKLNFIRDITQQRRLEAQLQRTQKMEAIGALAGGVAHDLNNILSGLVSYPEVLLMDIPEESPLRRPIVTMQKSGEKAAAIVQDLLTLARRGVATTEVVNLNDILSEYLHSPEHAKLKSFHPEVQVKTHLERDLLNIVGSPVHLSKTVMNLVYNAAEAMPEGGIISIDTENRYLDRPIKGYDYVEEGEYVTLTVSDYGVGISAEDRERIFEPFYTKKVIGRSGTGLGMAVVWGTVKDHRGYIDVQSAEGRGTTITLYFPVTREQEVKRKALVSIEDYRGKGESIVVVDDVKEQRQIATSMLKKLGYNVTSVPSGEDAVEYLRTTSADLMVLDMIMDPGIDGLETYKRILTFRPHQRAIIVSGFLDMECAEQAQRLGAGTYVKKPYLLEKIGLAVRDELDRNR
jgi:PAS domain S-box-containing protein